VKENHAEKTVTVVTVVTEEIVTIAVIAVATEEMIAVTENHVNKLKHKTHSR
jgi:hypothetical protein